MNPKGLNGAGGAVDVAAGLAVAPFAGAEVVVVVVSPEKRFKGSHQLARDCTNRDASIGRSRFSKLSKISTSFASSFWVRLPLPPNKVSTQEKGSPLAATTCRGGRDGRTVAVDE